MRPCLESGRIKASSIVRGKNFKIYLRVLAREMPLGRTLSRLRKPDAMLRNI